MKRFYKGNNPPGADHGEPGKQPYRYTGVCKAKDLTTVLRHIELKEEYELRAALKSARLY